MNEDGTPMSEEEIVHKRKYLEFANVTYPEVNPIEMLLLDHKGNGQVRLQTYRYPCPEGIERKGIVQWIHGLNDYSGRYAVLAKMLSENGYEVVTMD